MVFVPHPTGSLWEPVRRFRISRACAAAAMTSGCTTAGLPAVGQHSSSRGDASPRASLILARSKGRPLSARRRGPLAARTLTPDFVATRPAFTCRAVICHHWARRSDIRSLSASQPLPGSNSFCPHTPPASCRHVLLHRSRNGANRSIPHVNLYTAPGGHDHRVYGTRAP